MSIKPATTDEMPATPSTPDTMALRLERMPRLLDVWPSSPVGEKARLEKVYSAPFSQSMSRMVGRGETVSAPLDYKSS